MTFEIHMHLSGSRLNIVLFSSFPPSYAPSPPSEYVPIVTATDKTVVDHTACHLWAVIHVL